MEGRRRRLNSNNEYCDEFMINLKELENNPQDLFKEWPIDIKKFSRDRKPVFVELAEVFLKYGDGPKKYLDKIEAIQRDSYRTDHIGEQKNITNRCEEQECKALFNFFKMNSKTLQKYYNKDKTEGIIEIIDYQIPLKLKKGDKGVGEIDLLGKDEKRQTLYLLEAKRINSKDHIFHTVLEVYTYYRYMSKSFDKLKEDFDIPSNYKVSPAIIFYKGSVVAKEFDCPLCSAVRCVMKELGVEAFEIDYEERKNNYKEDLETIENYMDNKVHKVRPSDYVIIKRREVEA